MVSFGPISVLPSHQKEGSGSALINHTQKTAEKMDYKAMVILPQKFFNAA
jgi:predicted N-acetyltransferase YhbS